MIIKINLLIALICSILSKNIALADDKQYFTNTNATNWLPENPIILHLDDNTTRILFDLFAEVFGNSADNKVELPVSLVGEIYRNYTQEQLDSLKSELNYLNRSFDAIKIKVNSLQERFTLAKEEYENTHNLSRFENVFIQIGEELLILQKLFLEITKDNIKQNETYLEGRRSPFLNIFDRLAGLLLGITTEPTYQQNVEPFLSFNRIKQVIRLMTALQTVKNVPTNSKLKPNSDLANLKNMLYRLQQIQELNRLANVRQKSETINPYRYEAVLNLVKLVGTASGANQLRSLLRVVSSPNVRNKVKQTNNVSQEKLRVLMKAIEEQESKRQKESEAQQQREIINSLLKNQQKQQEQINNLIKMIQSQNRGTQLNEETNDNNIVKGNTPESSLNLSPSGSSASNQELVNRLREQRQQLNKLLKSLGQQNKVNNNEMAETNSQNIDMNKAQETFTNLLKNIGPIMGALAASGLITQKQNQSSQNSLLDLLKSTNNRGLQYDSNKSKIKKFLEELKSILDS